jgi:cellulose synthase/poly-beta-1,6-N-acetylglucosamine synthase-like glycosyltransferase
MGGGRGDGGGIGTGDKRDNSVKVVQKYVDRYPGKIRLIVNSRNSGGAAEPTNIGVKAAKYDYICVTDDDSAPEPDALIKMIGFLQNDSKVAAVTCAVMARGSRTFMQKLQMIEYSIIAWNRKLLDFIDAVYVTPGPFLLTFLAFFSHSEKGGCPLLCLVNCTWHH